MKQKRGSVADLKKCATEAKENTFFIGNVSFEEFVDYECYTEIEVIGHTSRDSLFIVTYDTDFAAKTAYAWPTIESFENMDFSDPEKVNAMSVALAIASEAGVPAVSMCVMGFHTKDQIKTFFKGMNYEYTCPSIVITFDEATKAAIAKKTEGLILWYPAA